MNRRYKREKDPSDPANYRQKWKLAYHFEDILKNKYPKIYKEDKLAHWLNGALYYYHENNGTQLSIGEFQDYLEKKEVPKCYIDHMEDWIKNNHPEYLEDIPEGMKSEDWD